MRILVLNGSTRANSANARLITAIIRMADPRTQFLRYPSIADLPHFNPGLDVENTPQEVIRFRELLAEADGVLICTPEYAMGVPGSLKNALDWCVGSSSFSGKPVMLVVASLSGAKALASLLDTLLVIEARVRPETTVHIPFASSKVNADAIITDDQVSGSLKQALHELLGT
jgi:NAD(P)H-dependent FMN reductase